MAQSHTACWIKNLDTEGCSLIVLHRPLLSKNE